MKASAHETLASLEATLRAPIGAGERVDLRWPDFSHHRADLENFYARSDNAPAWLRDGQPTPQALQMIDILREADGEGLRAEDYDSARWTERLTRLQRQHSPSDEVRFDAALTVSAMRYVSDHRVGRINPRYFKIGLDVRPNQLDLPTFVRQHLASETDLKSELAGIEPPFVGYRQLRKALLRYMRLAREDDGESLPMPADLGYPGPPYAGAARLTRLLRLLGDLPDDYSEGTASSWLYNAALVQAVRRFQGRHVLQATGYLDAATIEQLNVPLSHRVDQIRLALERFRWERYDFPQSPIVVNIPGFRLYAFDEEGKIALTMRVDVGEDFDDARTPVMEGSIEYVVFRPYWNVPAKIQRDEIIPIVTANPNYLFEYHFEALTPPGQVIASGRIAATMLREIRAGKLRLRQRPGSDNPMGLVKFVFPNRYDVYLHDIPSREFFFAFQQRVVSHGCVHVEKPADLAVWLLRDQPGWTLERVQRAMHNGQDDLRVGLLKQVPVLFVYTTVAARENGEIDFYPDIYGYDAKLLLALARGYPYQK